MCLTRHIVPNLTVPTFDYLTKSKDYGPAHCFTLSTILLLPYRSRHSPQRSGNCSQVPYWTTSVFSSTVADLVLIYESVNSSASVVRWLTLHNWTLNYWISCNSCQLRLFYNFGANRIYKLLSHHVLAVPLLFCFSLFNSCRRNRYPAMGFSAAIYCCRNLLTEPFPSNYHIPAFRHHITYRKVSRTESSTHTHTHTHTHTRTHTGVSLLQLCPSTEFVSKFTVIEKFFSYKMDMRWICVHEWKFHVSCKFCTSEVRVYALIRGKIKMY
jgi:hypothetical protein